MFTGLIEEIGKVKSFDGKILKIEANKVLEKTKIGDSIAINGCCQTVIELSENTFSVEVSRETLDVTNFSALKSGDTVNLERALTLESRLGGHIVQGHIETLTTLVNIEKQNDFYNMTFSFDEKYGKYIVKKGSITLNGISLTVAKLDSCKLVVAVIPHTFDNTNLKYLKIGDRINLETDIIAKYVENFLSRSDNSVIDDKFLVENGFM